MNTEYHTNPDPETLQFLIRKARDIRIDTIMSLSAAGSGHTGGSLGLADVFTSLYFHLMKHDPGSPSCPDRDRLVLSIGHVAPVLYTTLAHAGYFPVGELQTLRAFGSRLQGHPGRDHGLPGIELSAGSLGQGLSVAVGMALAGKADQAKWRVICILGDGELQEGSIWEAAMSAAHHKLGKLVAVVDRNGVQIDGKTSEVMQIEPLAKKWEAFGWIVHTCHGNDIEDFIKTWNTIPADDERQPHVIIANTMMGKGVPEIENDYRWHGRAPKAEEAKRFIQQILESHG